MAPHGTPDWGLTGPKETVHGLDDMGELAVRGGSPHLWDRRGDVVFSSDFRDGMSPFIPTAGGVGGAIVLSTGHTRQGAYSLKLTARSDDPFYAHVDLQLPIPRTRRLGLEFSFSLDEETAAWSGALALFDGADYHRAAVRYDHVNRRLEHYSLLDGYIPFADPVWGPEHAYPSNTIKLVANFDAGFYARVLMNDAVWTLPTVAIDSMGLVGAANLRVRIYHYAVAGENPVGYLDNVIVTQNEP